MLEERSDACGTDPATRADLEKLVVAPETVAAPEPETLDGVKLLIGFCFAVSLICSVDRSCMSVAMVPMSQQLEYSDAAKGQITSLFLVGYTISNLLAGVAVTKYSPKTVLAWGATLWSLFTLLTPPAACTSLTFLLGARFMMGVGEGVAFPSIQQLYRMNVPSASRSRVLALTYSGAQLGSVVALGTTPLLIQTYDWPVVFFLFGSIGLGWVALWVPLVKNISESAVAQAALPGGAAVDIRSSSEDDKEVASSSLVETQKEAADIPWRTFLSNPSFLALWGAHASFGFYYFMIIAWSPTFYASEFGVDVGEAAHLTLLPWLGTLVTTNAAGWLADYLMETGRLSRTDTRKLFQCGPGLIQVGCLAYLAWELTNGNITIHEAFVLLTTASMMGGMQAAGFGSNHGDLSGKYTGIIFGVTNASASLAGATNAYASGLLLDATHNWGVVFATAAAVITAGSLGYLKYGSGEQQFE